MTKKASIFFTYGKKDLMNLKLKYKKSKAGFPWSFERKKSGSKTRKLTGKYDKRGSPVPRDRIVIICLYAINGI